MKVKAPSTDRPFARYRATLLWAYLPLAALTMIALGRVAPAFGGKPRPRAAILPPRPLAPPSTSRVTSASPLLRWALAANTTGAEVEICADRACSKVVQRIRITGSQGSPLSPLARGTWFWRLRGQAGEQSGTLVSSTWQFTVGARSHDANHAWGSILDVNGDGLGDAAIAAIGRRGNSVFVHLGQTTGLSPKAAMRLFVAGHAPAYGQSLASAGDVNGDGYADLVVGAPTLPNAVYVYHGGAAGLSKKPVVTLAGGTLSNFGTSVAGAGDINGDGYADVLVGTDANVVNIYHGGPAGLSMMPSTTITVPDKPGFGLAVASAGDVNGDGYADVIIGAQRADAAVVYTGGRDGLHMDPARILTGPPHSQFGCAVAGAGDVNGDGYTDVIVGSCDADRAFVFLGGASGLSTAPAFTLPCDGNAPRYVAGLGDVNGDGFSDVIVGTLQSARSGAMSLYLGGPTALSRPLGVADPGVVSFGPPMVGLGDVNRDGFDDAIAGAAEASELFFYKGGATLGEDDSWAASATLTGPPDSGFGAAFGGASY